MEDETIEAQIRNILTVRPVRKQAAMLVRAGLSPTNAAEIMGKKDLKNLLLLQVGERELRLSDIFFSIPKERRDNYELICQRFDNWHSMIQSARSRRLDVDEFELYGVCRDAAHGDLYVCIADIEIRLHTQIKQILVSEFGENNSGWWRKGIPSEVRKRCVVAKEEEENPMEDPYNYTTLIHLKEIIDKQWLVFSRSLPKEFEHNKPLLMKDLLRLNSLRNSVMHPVKKATFDKTDLDFVTSLRDALAPAKWRHLPIGRLIAYNPNI